MNFNFDSFEQASSPLQAKYIAFMNNENIESTNYHSVWFGDGYSSEKSVTTENLDMPWNKIT